MAIEHHEIPAHLNYFLCIEDDLQRLSRWIEFSPDNEAVYSIELARLLMTASAEVDVVAKALCKAIDNESKASDIHAYQSKLIKAVPMLSDAKVLMPRYGMTFNPWESWHEKKNPPDWWRGNNKVKHHRAEHFNQANLKNVLNATAGLLLLLLLFYSKESIYLYPTPRFFVPSSFAVMEGEALRLVIADGTELPWA